MSEKMSTKYCFVLSCLNNSKKNPDKWFFYVPTSKNKRDKWCEAVGRRKESIGPRSPTFCCSDHFNVDEDFQDVVGTSKPKLKAGIIPFIKYLDTSNDSIVSYSSHISETNNTSDESTLSSSMSDSSVNATDSDWRPTTDETTSSDCEGGDIGLDDIDDVSDQNLNFLRERRDLADRKQQLLLETEFVKNFFGIELAKMYLVDIIAEQAGVSKTHILLCLQKIKQNLSFVVLAFDYALSPSHCGRIFKDTVYVMAKALAKFVVWSDKEVVEHRLPIAFRANFKEVVSIIDCFEIQIQKPSNPVHQSHTWSQYKECNTVKYLVSSTPDGIINFISEGFGGRISDLEMVRCSGYLDVLPRNSVVMADRGFKSIETLLQAKDCRLVRPPSVSTGKNMTKDEVRLTKRVAALRIHIERVIKRYREFAMLLPHATVNINFLSSINYVINVASALINIQNAIIK